MKAYVLRAINDLRYDEIDVPPCPKSWALVKVKAAGICSSDIPRIFSKGTYRFPTIPGHEFSGIVHSVADEKDQNLIGKRIGVFPLIPCKECQQCENKHYEMCEHYDYLGSRRDGGFAEYVAVPIWNLIELPNAVRFEQAAMLEPLSVAFHAVKTAGVKQGARVAIIGTGMIGIAAGQWAFKQGAASVTVIGRSEGKRNLVEKSGLKYTVSDADNVYDFVLEAVGTPTAIETAINHTAPGGTTLLMGNPSGNIELPQNVYWRILRKQLTLKGTWNSCYDGVNSSDWTMALNAIAKGEIDVSALITHTFEQSELPVGLNLMREHKEPYCKVMTTWNNK